MPRVDRVLVIQTQGENAGAQEISRLVGAGLSARGYRVEHLFFYRKSNSFDEPPNTTYCSRERPRTPLDVLRFFWKLGRIIRHAQPEAILTFQHYGNTVGGLAARLVSSAPIIANQVSAAITMNWLVKQADLLMGRIGTFHRITVNSAEMLREYARYPAAYSRRLTYIPHGFDRKTSLRSKSAARQHLGLPVDGPLIGSVGRLHPTKRLDVAIRMLRHQPDWHLALAGQGPQEQELRSLAADIGAADRVRFLGELSPGEVGEFLACLDAFVFPTQAETFGLAAVEAASAGIPVVATDLPILREVLSDADTSAALFVDASDDQVLAAGVSRVLTERQLRQDLVLGGRTLSTRYSVDRMVDAYEEVLKDLGASPDGRSIVS